MAATKSVVDINSNGQTGIENISASSMWESDPVDVSKINEGILSILFGRTAVTAAGAGVTFIVQYSHDASGDNTWRELLRLGPTQFALCETEAVSGTVNAGATTIPVASSTNLTAGELIYIKNGTLDNSEWRLIKAVAAGPTLDLFDALANAQTSSNIYDIAEEFGAWLNLKSIRRIRIIGDGSTFTQAWDVLIKFSYEQK